MLNADLPNDTEYQRAWITDRMRALDSTTRRRSIESSPNVIDGRGRFWRFQFDAPDITYPLAPQMNCSFNYDPFLPLHTSDDDCA
jgi:hypothetical protein